jgi:hypothetical protein
MQADGRPYARSEAVWDRRVVDDVARVEAGIAGQSGQIAAHQRNVAGAAEWVEERTAPRHHLAVGIEAAAHVDQRWGTFRVPAMLVGPHPLHAHRLADSAGSSTASAAASSWPLRP